MKSKISLYKWPIIILVGSIIISIGISFVPDGILDIEKKITIALSILGIGYAIFQFWVGEINTNKRRLYDLRFLSYREISDEMHKIIELFISDLPSNKCVDCENFHSSVISITNRILVQIDLLNALVFKDIKNKNECTNLHNSLIEIVNETEKFRENMFQNINSEESNKQSIQFRWTVKMNPILKKFNNSINDFQNMLKSYF